MKRLEISFFEKYMDNLVIKDKEKLSAIIDWLENIIRIELNSITINDNILMPKKRDLAEFLEVGIGTVQNAYRCLEDKGLLASKQCVGTFIVFENDLKILKSTSKKDVAFNMVKKHLKKKGLEVGDELKSIRYYAKKIKVSPSIILQVFKQMEELNIIENKLGKRFLKERGTSFVTENHDTLVDKIYLELKDYIIQNLKIGDKVPSISNLVEKYNVSMKTIHSSIKKLSDEGVLMSLAGRYGTTVVRIPLDNVLYQKPETSIFASSKETYYYHYERILSIIRKMIVDNFGIGSKLPSISELSLLLDVNPNTIRKSFEVLKQEGIVTSVRGRYGGTFVLEMPDLEAEQSYQWLAVNSDFSL